MSCEALRGHGSILCISLTQRGPGQGGFGWPAHFAEYLNASKKLHIFKAQIPRQCSDTSVSKPHPELSPHKPLKPYYELHDATLSTIVLDSTSPTLLNSLQRSPTTCSSRPRTSRMHPEGASRRSCRGGGSGKLKAMGLGLHKKYKQRYIHIYIFMLLMSVCI